MFGGSRFPTLHQHTATAPCALQVLEGSPDAQVRQDICLRYFRSIWELRCRFGKPGRVDVGHSSIRREDTCRFGTGSCQEPNLASERLLLRIKGRIEGVWGVVLGDL